MIYLNTKWNDYPSDVLYLWNGKTIFRIAEGNGSNLSDEDIDEGYKDYWITDYYNFGVGNGGQWMETELISDIDYTVQGIINLMKECDLWDSNWKIIDEEIGEQLMDYFEDYHMYKNKAKYYKELAQKLCEEVNK